MSHLPENVIGHFLKAPLDNFSFLMMYFHQEPFGLWGEILYISVFHLDSPFNYVISLISDLLLRAHEKYVHCPNLLGQQSLVSFHLQSSL